MSKFLKEVASIEFSSLVKAIYQAKGFHLRDTVRTKSDVRGKSIKFPLMGEGMAQQKASQDDVSPMNITYVHKEAILTNWNAVEYTDIFDQQEVAFDDKRELAEAIAMAIGRRSDQILIGALDSSTTSNLIPVGGTGFTFAKLRDINKFLNANGVGREGRTIALTAGAEAQLLDQEKITSNDFVSQMALNNGGLDNLKIFNFMFKVIPTMGEGGLPGTDTDRTCFAYAHDSVGFATGLNFRTEVNYIPEKLSWLSAGIFQGGAIPVDDKGIVKISIDETV